jgi:hypothetical protein
MSEMACEEKPEPHEAGHEDRRIMVFLAVALGITACCEFVRGLC